LITVIPAKAGIRAFTRSKMSPGASMLRAWVPAFAGMTVLDDGFNSTQRRWL